MKSSIFWDIMPYSPLKIDQRFGGTYRLHLHERRIYQTETSRACLIATETSVHFQRTTRSKIKEIELFTTEVYFLAVHDFSTHNYSESYTRAHLSLLSDGHSFSGSKAAGTWRRIPPSSSDIKNKWNFTYTVSIRFYGFALAQRQLYFNNVINMFQNGTKSGMLFIYHLIKPNLLCKLSSFYLNF
jgi:hypothetical protein